MTEIYSSKPAGSEFISPRDWRALGLFGIAIFTTACSLGSVTIYPPDADIAATERHEKIAVTQTAYMEGYQEHVINATLPVTIPSLTPRPGDDLSLIDAAEPDVTISPEDKLKNMIDIAVARIDPNGVLISSSEIKELKDDFYLMNDSHGTDSEGRFERDTRETWIIRGLIEAGNDDKALFDITHEIMHWLLIPKDWRKRTIFDYGERGFYFVMNNGWDVIIIDIPVKEDESLDFSDEEKTEITITGKKLIGVGEAIAEMFTFAALGIEESLSEGESKFSGDTTLADKVVVNLREDQARFDNLFSLARNDPEGFWREFGRILSELNGESIPEEDLILYSQKIVAGWIGDSTGNFVPFSSKLVDLYDFQEFKPGVVDFSGDTCFGEFIETVVQSETSGEKCLLSSCMVPPFGND